MAKAVKKKVPQKKATSKKAAPKKAEKKSPQKSKPAPVVKPIPKVVEKPQIKPEFIVKRKAPEPTPVKIAAPEVMKAPSKPAHQNVAWTNLPLGFPAQIKFLVQMAERECNSISNVPFSFAKFIHALPRDMCGLQFGLLLLTLEHDRESISKLCRMDKEKVDELIDEGREKIGEKFSEMCGDLERKWSGYRKDSGRSLEAVIEPYLISKMDRNLQLLVGAVLLNR